MFEPGNYSFKDFIEVILFLKCRVAKERDTFAEQTSAEMRSQTDFTKLAGVFNILAVE